MILSVAYYCQSGPGVSFWQDSDWDAYLLGIDVCHYRNECSMIIVGLYPWLDRALLL